MGGVHGSKCRRIDLSAASPTTSGKAGVIRESLCSWPISDTKYSFAKQDGTVYSGDHPITLIVGGTYTIDIFHAQRSKARASRVYMETDLALRSRTAVANDIETSFEVQWDLQNTFLDGLQTHHLQPISGWPRTHPMVKYGRCGTTAQAGDRIPAVMKWNPYSNNADSNACSKCCACTSAYDAEDCKNNGQVLGVAAVAAFNYPERGKSNVGMEYRDTVTVALIRDADNRVFFFLSVDDVPHSSGIHTLYVSVTSTGVAGKGTSVLLRNDRGTTVKSCVDATNDCYAWDTQTGAGTFMWRWSSQSDGMILGPLPKVTGTGANDGFELIIKITSSTGVQYVQAGDYEPLDASVSVVDLTRRDTAPASASWDDYVKDGIKIKATSSVYYCSQIAECGECTANTACGWCENSATSKCLPESHAEQCVPTSTTYPSGVFTKSGCACRDKCTPQPGETNDCDTCVKKSGCGFLTDNLEVSPITGQCIPGTTVEACDVEQGRAALYVPAEASFTSVDIKGIKLNHTQGWTVEGWMLPRSSTYNPLFTIKRANGDICWTMSQSFSIDVLDGMWHHVALMYDPFYAGYARVYIDGEFYETFNTVAYDIAGVKSLTMSPNLCIGNPTEVLTLSVSSGADTDLTNPQSYGYDIWISSVVVLQGARSVEELARDVEDLGCPFARFDNPQNVPAAENPVIAMANIGSILSNKLSGGRENSVFTISEVLDTTYLNAGSASMTITANQPEKYLIGADFNVSLLPGCQDPSSTRYQARWNWGACTTPAPTPVPTTQPTTPEPTPPPSPQPTVYISESLYPRCPAVPNYAPITYTQKGESSCGAWVYFAKQNKWYGHKGLHSVAECQKGCSRDPSCTGWRMNRWTGGCPYGIDYCWHFYSVQQGSYVTAMQRREIYQYDPKAAFKEVTSTNGEHGCKNTCYGTAGCKSFVYRFTDAACYLFDTESLCPHRGGDRRRVPLDKVLDVYVSGGRAQQRPDCGTSLFGYAFVNKLNTIDCPDGADFCQKEEIPDVYFSQSMACQERCRAKTLSVCAAWTFMLPSTCYMFTQDGLQRDPKLRYVLNDNAACGTMDPNQKAQDRTDNSATSESRSQVTCPGCEMKDVLSAPADWPKTIPSPQAGGELVLYGTKIQVFPEVCTVYKKCARASCDQAVSQKLGDMGVETEIWQKFEVEGTTVCEVAAEGLDDDGKTFNKECTTLCENHACMKKDESCQMFSSYDVSVAANTAEARGPASVPLFTIPRSFSWPDAASDTLKFKVSATAMGGVGVTGIQEVAVRFHALRHARVGDVSLKLTSPDGTTVTVFDGNGHPCADNHFGGSLEFCGDECEQDPRWYIADSRRWVVASLDPRCLDDGSKGCMTREYQRMVLGPAKGKRYGGVYTWSSTSGSDMACVAYDASTGGNVDPTVTIKVASMQDFVGTDKQGAGEWILELADSNLGNIGFFDHAELILTSEMSDIPINFFAESIVVATSPTTNTALSMDAGGLPSSPPQYLNNDGAAPSQGSVVDYSDKPTVWLNVDNSNMNKTYVHYSSAATCFAETALQSLRVVTLHNTEAAPPKPDIRLQDVRSSTLTLRWAFKADSRRRRRRLRRRLISGLISPTTNIVATGDQLEVTLTKTDDSSYLCWRTAGSGSTPSVTCSENAGTLNSGAVVISSTTTGSSTVCGAKGATWAEWSDVTQKQVAVIECTAKDSPVDTAVQTTLEVAAEYPVVVWFAQISFDLTWRIWSESTTSGSSHSMRGLRPGATYKFKVQGYDETTLALGEVSDVVEATMCNIGCIECAPKGICLACDATSVLKDNKCVKVLLEGCPPTPLNYRFGNGHAIYDAGQATSGRTCNGSAVCSDCKLCPVGMERVNCGGFSPGTCQTCKPGFFKSIIGGLYPNPPAGQNSASEPCKACAVCGTGDYAAVECTTVRDTVCETCPRNSTGAAGSVGISSCMCDSGFFRDGDVCTICPIEPEKCERCNPGGCTKCVDGYYLRNGQCVLACEDQEYAELIDLLDVNGGRKCVACEACAVGFGISGCEGEKAGTCDFCMPGTWRNASDPNVFDCRDCVSFDGDTGCPADSYMSFECQGSNERRCSKCQPCPAGAHRVGCNGTSAGECQACPDGTFKDWIGTYEDKCETCWKCPSDMYTSSQCTAQMDSGMCVDCTPCRDGQYEVQSCEDDHNTICKACPSCSPGTEPATNQDGTIICGQDGDATNPGVCVPCQSGFFKAARYANDDDQSSIVPSPWNEKCIAVTPCAANEYAATSATSFADNVCVQCSQYGRNGVDWWTNPETKSCEKCTVCAEQQCQKGGLPVVCEVVTPCTFTSNALCGVVDVDVDNARSALAMVEATKSKFGATLGVLLPLGLCAIFACAMCCCAVGLGAIVMFVVTKRHSQLRKKMDDLVTQEELEDELEREMKMKMGSGDHANQFNDGTVLQRRKSAAEEFNVDDDDTDLAWDLDGESDSAEIQDSSKVPQYHDNQF
jgi:subtilisin-like proprotein convertase family protein